MEAKDKAYFFTLIALGIFLFFSVWLDGQFFSDLRHFVIGFGMCYCIIVEFQRKMTPWMIALAIIMVVYNPFFPIDMSDDDSWVMLHGLVSVILVSRAVSLYANQPGKNKTDEDFQDPHSYYQRKPWEHHRGR